MNEDVILEEHKRLVRANHCNNHKVLTDILTNVNKCYLYGAKDYIKLMRNHIKALSAECEVEELFEDSKVEDSDIVFILTLNGREFYSIAQKLAKKHSCSLLQIIPPSCFFTKLLAEKRGVVLDFDLSDAQLPFLAGIDIVDTCNLSCKTCTREAFSYSSGRMEFSLFKRILDKLQLMNIKQIELYNFTEPFLHPDIYDFMKEVKVRGLTLGVSTNLSLKNIPNLKECVDLLMPGDWFVVTISGIEKDVYGINHAGGNIDNVLHNLSVISQSSNSKMVTLRLLHFDYNEDEVFKAVAIAQKFGLGFQWFDAFGSPFEKSSEKEMMQEFVQNGVSLRVTNGQYGEDVPYCRFIHSRNIEINYLGNVEQCCNRVARPYDFGSFLEQDISIIQLKREMSPICDKCEGRYYLKEDMFAVDYDKVRRLLKNGVDTLGTVRSLSPVAVYANIKSNSEYVNKVKHYYVEKALNRTVQIEDV